MLVCARIVCGLLLSKMLFDCNGVGAETSLVGAGARNTCICARAAKHETETRPLTSVRFRFRNANMKPRPSANQRQVSVSECCPMHVGRVRLFVCKASQIKRTPVYATSHAQ